LFDHDFVISIEGTGWKEGFVTSSEKESHLRKVKAND